MIICFHIDTSMSRWITQIGLQVWVGPQAGTIPTSSRFLVPTRILAWMTRMPKALYNAPELVFLYDAPIDGDFSPDAATVGVQRPSSLPSVVLRTQDN